MPIYDRETIKAAVGTEIGVSDWLLITQDMVNQFATLTRDPVELHTNVELAKQTPFGGTIAHGLFFISEFHSMSPGIMASPPVALASVRASFCNSGVIC